MKWPSSLTLIRHGESRYNILKQTKANDKTYQLFKSRYQRNHRGLDTRILASIIRKKYALGIGDWDTSLTQMGRLQAYYTGLSLKDTQLPDIVYVSPYKRTLSTYQMLCQGWSGLRDVLCVVDERIREQEHGISNLYNDKKVFFAHHPDQKDLYEAESAYWYQFPQGENVPMVRERARSFLSTLVREHNDQRVLLITHHLTILSMRAALERWDPIEFMQIDEEQKPINCGVTIYEGHPEKGKDGKLDLNTYNTNLWESHFVK